jgi:hypothetical protein
LLIPLFAIFLFVSFHVIRKCENHYKLYYLRADQEFLKDVRELRNVLIELSLPADKFLANDHAKQQEIAGQMCERYAQEIHAHEDSMNDLSVPVRIRVDLTASHIRRLYEELEVAHAAFSRFQLVDQPLSHYLGRQESSQVGS